MDYVLNKTFGTLHYNNDFSTGDVDFADDIALTAKDANSAQLILRTLYDVAKCFGLRVNASKTKAMFINCDESRLFVDDKPLENVKSFVYLGSTISQKGSTALEIGRRIGLASANFGNLRKCLWDRDDISVSTKIRVFKTAILPTILYACETWVPLKTTINTLEVFQMRCLRRILKINTMDFKKNIDIREETNTYPIESIIRQKRLQWFGHVMRMDKNRQPHKVYTITPDNWKRKRHAGPVKKWNHLIIDDVKDFVPPNIWKPQKILRYAESYSLDRKRWKSFCSKILK